MSAHKRQGGSQSKRASGNIVRWADEIDIRVAAAIPTLVALGLIGLSQVFPQRASPSIVEKLISDGVGVVALLTGSLGGLVQVWRRESPGPLGGSIVGKAAVVVGWIWAALWWGAAILWLIIVTHERH